MMDRTVKRVEAVLRSPLTLLGLVIVVGVLTTPLLYLTFPLYKGVLADPLGFRIVVMAILLLTILNATALCIFFERKVAGFTQDRMGPNRVGFWGLFQSIADGLKMFLKEDIIPERVDKPIFHLAPAIALVTSLIGFAIIPWGGYVQWPWAETVVSTQVATLNIGILYILAISSLGVYAVVLAGYASNSKYSFFGGMRAAAQMISYELPLGLAILCTLLVTGSLQLDVIVEQQARSGLWYVFVQPLPFLLLLISIFAETNRAPFDLAEAEQELVGGFHTEYSSMKFGLFFLGEYAHMITGSAVIVALFFGGYHFWGLPGPDNHAWWAMLLRCSVFVAKVAVFIALFMVVRWTLPRFRFDQLMRIAWLSMVPIGILQLALTAVVVGFVNVRDGWNWLLITAVNVIGLAVMLVMAARSRTPVTGRQSHLPAVEVRPT